jgi:hypothetical protein
MALQTGDLFYVQRTGTGAGNYKMQAGELLDFIAGAEGTLNYRGTVDCTKAVGDSGGQLDPNPPVSGDLYINTGDGNVDTTGSDKTDAWVGINAANTAIEPGQRVVFDGNNWAIVGAESGGGIEEIGVTPPITVDNSNPSKPVIGIKEATNSDHGSVQLADAPPNTGKLTSTNTTDVLSVPHFNELVDRIDDVESHSGISSIVANPDGDPLSVATDTDGKATISIKDATTAQKGVTIYADQIQSGNTIVDKSTTPKSVADYAVPLNLTVLGNLP